MRDKINAIRADMQAVMDVVAEKHNVTIAFDGNIRYSDTQIHCRMVVTANDGTRRVEAREDNFRRLCRRYGLYEQDLGREVNVAGTLYRVTGIKPRNKKYPVLMDRVRDGKPFKFPAAAVQEALNRVA